MICKNKYIILEDKYYVIERIDNKPGSCGDPLFINVFVLRKSSDGPYFLAGGRSDVCELETFFDVSSRVKYKEYFSKKYKNKSRVWYKDRFYVKCTREQFMRMLKL